MVIIIVAYYAYRLIKGRHCTLEDSSVQPSKAKANASNDASNATTVHVHNTVQCDATPKIDIIESKPQNRAANTNRGPSFTLNEFNENSVVDVWIAKLERYLKYIEEPDWIEVTLAHINDACLARLGDINKFYEDKSGLQSIKASLRKNFGTNEAIERKADFFDLAQRVQQPEETVVDYGNKLLKMAKNILNVEDANVIDQLKSLFARGLTSEELQIIALDKIGNEKVKNKERMSFLQLIDYMRNKDESRSQSAKKRAASTASNATHADSKSNSSAFETAIFSATGSSSGYESGGNKNAPRQVYQQPSRQENPRYGLRYTNQNIDGFNSSKYSSQNYQNKQRPYNQDTRYQGQGSSSNHVSFASAPSNQSPLSSNQSQQASQAA